MTAAFAVGTCTYSFLILFFNAGLLLAREQVDRDRNPRCDRISYPTGLVQHIFDLAQRWLLPALDHGLSISRSLA